MTEMVDNIQIKEGKISKTAIISLVIAIIDFLCIAVYRHAEGLALLALLILTPFTLIVSIFSLFEIRRSGGKLKETGLVISAIIILLIASVPFGHSVFTEKIISRVTCRCSIIELRKAVLAYANENGGDYPSVDTWCDLLIERDSTNTNHFCKALGKGPGKCHYAINPDCKSDSPGNTVLFFETKGGCNQHGGLDMLTADDNYKKGWRVIFNDGRRDFIEPHELDKLVWK